MYIYTHLPIYLIRSIPEEGKIIIDDFHIIRVNMCEYTTHEIFNNCCLKNCIKVDGGLKSIHDFYPFVSNNNILHYVWVFC